MTNSTGGKPVSPGSAAGIVAIAEAVQRNTAQLTEFATASGFRTLDEAADLLGISTGRVRSLIAECRLTAVCTSAATLICPASLHLHAVERTTQAATSTMALRSTVATALRDYLAARPVSAYWSQARTQHRPIVSGRRGRRVWANFGIHYHSVAFSASWLAAWANAQPGAEILPVGAALLSALLELDGVDEQHHVTPLGDGGGSHRLSGWVRVDPSLWTVAVPDDVSELINTAPSAT